MHILSTSPDIIVIQGKKNILDLEEIRSEILNENLIQLAGELPYAECWLKLVVFSEEDLHRAKEVIAVYEAEEPDGENWVCSCGEQHAFHFTECWSCGATDRDL